MSEPEEETIEGLLEQAEEAAVRELARRVLDSPSELKAHELIRAAEVLARRSRPADGKPAERKPTTPNLEGLPPGRAQELQGSSERPSTVAEDD